MKNKDTRTLAERAEDLSKVLTFKIVSTIRNKTFYPNGLDDFKAQYGRITSGKPIIYKEKDKDKNCNEQVDFVARYSFTQADYRKILGYRFENGKHYHISLEDIKPYLPKWLHLQKNFTRHYKSGKHFKVESYWYIDFDVLNDKMNDDRICNTDSDYYSQRQHLYIDKLIFGFKQEKKKEATKMNETTRNKETKTTEYPDEEEDVSKNVPKATEVITTDDNTTSTEELCERVNKLINGGSRYIDTSEIDSIWGRLYNRSKSSKAEYRNITILLSEYNLSTHFEGYKNKVEHKTSL